MSSKSTGEVDDLVARSATKNEEEVDANFSHLVLQEIGFVKESFEAVKHKADQVIDDANEARKQFEELMLLPEGRSEERIFKLRQLKKKVSKLRMKIPFKLIAPEEQPHPNINYWPRPESDLYQDNDSHSKITIYYDHDHGNYCDDNSPALSYHELESTIRGLASIKKQYLSCFLFFPENAFIKMSVLRCWYPELYFTANMDQQLGFLVERRLIQAVYKKYNVTVAGYRMYPSVHSKLRSNISWFGEHPPSEWYVGNSHDVYEKYIYYTIQDFKRFIPTGDQKWVLHLGKWNISTEQHIEVLNSELFFKDMSKLINLRFVSLRGISMIEELPNFITELKRLRFLDLKACHNLEVIPPSIANLEYLERLDISECYFLNHMPKALAKLRYLEVLKGFVVGENREGNSCSLEDLASLQFLKKLDIYTSMKGFPNKSQIETLQHLRRLRSLTISWGGCAATNGLGKSNQKDEYDGLKSEMTTAEDHEILYFSIEKLDLQCVPETFIRRWLKPTNFRNLKKLYIIGGKFYDLSKESQWNVKTLRLKHLSNLNIDWGELKRLFPKLSYLEKVNCPNLDQFPCDDIGIWMKNEQH